MTRLAPEELLALMIARGQVERGDAVTPNIAATVTMALVRLLEEQEVDD